MLHRARCRRSALLALCVLSACAAAGPDDTAQPDGVSGAFLAGRFAQHHMDVPAAASRFLAALQADGASTSLRTAAFDATLMDGRAEALDLARALPGNALAAMALGNADVRAGQWRAAEARFATLTTDETVTLLRPLLMAWAQQGAGATDEAANTLRPFLDGNRNRGLFMLHAAMIADLAGRDADAGRLYRSAISALGGLNLRLGVIVANWQYRRGQGDDARQTIAAMANISPDMPIAEAALMQSIPVRAIRTAADGIAEAYLAMGAALQQRDSNDLALVMLHLALDIRPDLTAARLLSAEILAAHSHPAEAAAILAPVRADDPLAALVDLRRAQYGDKDGHTAEAEATLERLAAEYQVNPQPLAILAEIQQAHKRFADSAGTFARAIARVPQPQARDWVLFYERGVAFDRAHDWPRAEADLRQALVLSPDQPLVLNYLGYAWTEQGRNAAEARRMLERAVELRPNEGSIIDSLGWLLLQQGDKAAAVRFLERAAELDSEDSTINAHLGDAYMATGRKGEAEIQWRRALILNPDPQDVKALQAKLGTADAPAPAAVSAERRAE